MDDLQPTGLRRRERKKTSNNQQVENEIQRENNLAKQNGKEKAGPRR